MVEGLLMAAPILSINLTSDLVTKATLNRIRRAVNGDAGDWIIETVVPAKFTRSAYHEGTAQRRTRKYRERKMRKVGHDIPLVLTGRMRSEVTRSAKRTATANGGRVKLRNYFPMSGEMRGELETLSPRQTQRLARRMERQFEREVNDPANRRKRKRR